MAIIQPTLAFFFVTLFICAHARRLQESYAILSDGALGYNISRDFDATSDRASLCNMHKLKLNVTNASSADVGSIFQLVCELWPSSWGHFPSKSTHALEDAYSLSKSLFQKGKAWIHHVIKGEDTFCWRRLNYAPSVPKRYCPNTFHPGKGIAEIPSEKPSHNAPIFCKKKCDEICGLGGKKHMQFWCKCKVQDLPANNTSHRYNSDTVVVTRYAWPKNSPCHTKPFTHHWGHSCYASCPTGESSLFGTKRIPVCDTDCSAQPLFKTPCALGCAKSKSDCADDAEAVILHTTETVGDIAAIASGQLEAVPVIHTVTGIIDAVYRLIKVLVEGATSLWGKLHKLPFAAAVAEILHDMTSTKQLGKDMKKLLKIAFKIITKLLHKAFNLDTVMGAIKGLLETFHLSTIMSVYGLFVDLYNPLCPEE